MNWNNPGRPEIFYAEFKYKVERNVFAASNTSDSIFSGSLEDNLATVTGNTTGGYTLAHTIVVDA